MNLRRPLITLCLVLSMFSLISCNSENYEGTWIGTAGGKGVITKVDDTNYKVEYFSGDAISEAISGTFKKSSTENYLEKVASNGGIQGLILKIESGELFLGSIDGNGMTFSK